MKKIVKNQMSLDEYTAPEEVELRGLCDDGYCPNCNNMVDDLAPVCIYCGKNLTWERWKKANADYLEWLRKRKNKE